MHRHTFWNVIQLKSTPQCPTAKLSPPRTITTTQPLTYTRTNQDLS